MRGCRGHWAGPSDLSGRDGILESVHFLELCRLVYSAQILLVCLCQSFTTFGCVFSLPSSLRAPSKLAFQTSGWRCPR